MTLRALTHGAAAVAVALAVSITSITARARGDEATAGHPLGEPSLPPKSLRGVRPARAATPADIPDIYGPGSVLDVGNLHMKVTNIGVIGNPFSNISSDPSAQWPGASGVEYLNSIVLAVGAINPVALDPNAVRRVSSGTEWRPPTLDPVDHIYRAYEGIVGGVQLINDDGDFDPYTGQRKIDEEFLDGHDDDGDGRIDEDYAAVGHLMFSCVMRDDTPAALAMVSNERHVPLGLECRQRAWAYAIPGFANFDVIEYTIINRSGHVLDSLYLGFPADLDAGSISVSAGYYIDDRDLPYFPNGDFRVPVSPLDPRYQKFGSGGLCPELPVRLNGFSVVDDDGDDGRTPGVASLLLFGHTTDPLGLVAPKTVGFASFRSFPNGASYANRGAPTTDQQRFDVLRAHESIDPETGLIAEPAREEVDDYAAWNSVGPFLSVPDGGSVSATIGLVVAPGRYEDLRHFPDDYALYRSRLLTLEDLRRRYPGVDVALTAQVAYEGRYERPRPGFAQLTPNCLGCESGFKLPLGSPSIYISEPKCSEEDEPPTRLVTDVAYTWFDMDCSLCTGLPGYYLRRWDSTSPPTPPNLNVAADYNYTDNPDRIVPAGDRQITLAWDNISENIPDPESGWFDFRSYRIWKAPEWRRPPGSAGPNDADWVLLSELRLFDYADSNFRHEPVTDTLICPQVYVPSYEFPPGSERCAPERALQYPSRVLLDSGGCRDSAFVKICLRRGDLWDQQSGHVVRPDPEAKCVRDSVGACVQDVGLQIGRANRLIRTRYQVGRYRFVDREVKNGFVYFYSITAGDSTGDAIGELFSRHTAVEAQAVTPQASTRAGRSAWVVPNPYRGYRNITERPSSWDQNPTAADPTGTHIDFMGLPRGPWTIRIYTVAGDLVKELRSEDPVNDSVRDPVIDSSGRRRPGFNRQQDYADDGQARWNLISRNGQDVVSGVYVFVVDSSQGQQRGRFVIIR